VVHVRAACENDLPTVDGLIRTTSRESSPLPVAEYPDTFLARTSAEDLLVATSDDEVVGFVKLGRPTSMSTNAHVLTIAGLGVAPSHRGEGLGRGLVVAAIEEARRRGARRLTLHVLGGNRGARDLYSSLGFVVEGVLRGEFLIDGRYVDDVLMARSLP
jgi:ribosomal protein S18 acetylase RimI-like enzyme